jgi:hypothetical protein
MFLCEHVGMLLWIELQGVDVNVRRVRFGIDAEQAVALMWRTIIQYSTSSRFHQDNFQYRYGYTSLSEPRTRGTRVIFFVKMLTSDRVSL